MAEPTRPQIYLITPPVLDLSSFVPRLARVMDDHEISCLRLTLATADEDQIARAADTLREVAHARDVAIVVENHVLLAERLGLDGVHLTDPRVNLRKLRTSLGKDAILGQYCAASRHDGISAAEAGVDYVAFGPVGGSALGDGTSVPHDLFEWWSEMIEIPVIAEGGLTEELVASLSPITDFFGIGAEIWPADDASVALKRLLSPLG